MSESDRLAQRHRFFGSAQDRPWLSSWAQPSSSSQQKEELFILQAREKKGQTGIDSRGMQTHRRDAACRVLSAFETLPAETLQATFLRMFSCQARGYAT